MNYTGSSYDGPYKNGNGHYKLPTETIYDGSIFDGMFNGEGSLKFPNGAEYVSKWVNGKPNNGIYVFSDGLKYEDNSRWSYCDTIDRRFQTDVNNGLRPAGNTRLTNTEPLRKIPDNHYDTGDGFLDPETSIVYSYDMEFLRNAGKFWFL